MDTLVFLANHTCGEPAGQCKFNVVNLANPLQPEVIATQEVIGGVYYMVQKANHVFVSCGISGIVTFDVTDPLSPTIAKCYFGPGVSGPLAIHGDHLIISDDMPLWSQERIRNCDPDSTSEADSLTRPGDLLIVDVSDPSSFNLVGSFPTGGIHRYLTVSESYIFITDESSDLLVLDNSRCDTVTTVLRQQLPQQAGKVCISGDYLYVPLGPLGLHIMDVSNPDSLVTVSEVATFRPASGVDIQGNYAYVTESMYGLDIIDISDPHTPQVVGSTPLEGRIIIDMAIQGNYAYVAGNDRMEIVDIADPAVPAVVGTFLGRFINNITVADTLAIVAGLYWFDIVNVADPSKPVVVGEWAGPDILDIDIEGDLIYLAAGNYGILVLDISNPDSVSIATEVATPRYARSIVVQDGQVFVADVFGIIRYRILGYAGNGHSLPTSFTLHQNHPNPFNHSTTITFNLNSSAHVTLEVLNILGQRVETLMDRMVPGGAVSAGWDASGYASGVYLYRLTVGDSQQTRKMLLLK